MIFGKYDGIVMQGRISRLALRDWDDIRLFLAVARAGSFNRAAAGLRICQSTVSRRIEQLEAEIGAKLFDRVGKGVTPTPAAAGILDRAQAMEEAAAAIERRVAGFDFEMEGVVRIAATEGIGTYWLTPRLLSLQREYPRLVIEVLAGNELADLASREADIAIRLGKPSEPALVALRVGTMRFGLYCSRQYADLYGLPESPEDLLRHRLVDHLGYAGIGEWRRLTTDHPGICYRTNTSTAYLEAVRAGYGIGLFPTYSGHIAPDLQPVPITIGMAAPIWLVSHEETREAIRVKRVLTFVRAAFEEDRGQWFS